ncbi:MAG: helix-turn-helix domain-containing protein [Epsilonproteobacteria bacterium]|nr:helix-turn-helix domain-containing protein [Campylobacterota bacterium]
MKRGLTQKEVAKRVHISKSNISRLGSLNNK